MFTASESSRRCLLPLLGVAVVLIAAGRAAAQGFSPQDALARMKVPAGLQVKLFAAEPVVRQPILVKCDDRGRLWVIQYLQYPNPAGLTRVKVDRFSRTVYDRVPEPPPRGPKGKDRITILADTDGDGRADTAKDFVSGLNLATGLAFGHGGVYVLQVPYLLFYPDANRDDVPDGDPQVLLEGFGMEDAQSLANHLTWGPDGWLYGVNGSTTTCNIRGIEFQQGVWRYHPLTKEFELFCEGGGNLFGLTFDEHGNLFYSSNGNFLFFHGMQGAYYPKNYGKHGPLHNPYAYGTLTNVKNSGPFLGPTTGGTIYLEDSFPPQFRGSFLAGNFLGHSAGWWKVQPRGSTFEATLQGTLLDSQDTWFGPTDLCVGPGGEVYLCDFCDKRTAHPDPDANWDRSNGRIYRIEVAGGAQEKPAEQLNLYKRSSADLIELLKGTSGWHPEQVRQILVARRDNAVVPLLREWALQEGDHRLALQALWALNVSGGFDDEIAARLLAHKAEYVRTWTVRLLGDAKRVSPEISKLLEDLARKDESVVVPAQLAATARRLPAKDGLPIVERLLERNIDEGDPQIPWLLWWAIEAKAVSDQELVLTCFARKEAWKTGLSQANARRLVRRYAAEGTKASYLACERLMESAPAQMFEAVLGDLNQGLSERVPTVPGLSSSDLFQGAAVGHRVVNPRSFKLEPLTPGLAGRLIALWEKKRDDPLRTRLALHAESRAAREHLLAKVTEKETPEGARLILLAILADFGKEDCVPVVLPLVDEKSDPVRLAALSVLRRYTSEEISTRLLAAYPAASAASKSGIRDLLFSRPASARAFLALVENKTIPAAEVPISELRRIALLENAELDELVRKHWGNIRPGTPEEKLAEMRRLSNDLRAAGGDRTSGRELFKKHCAVCHKLFGEGGVVGPDLTTFSRKDREAMLLSLVDPSAVIKSQYLSYIVATSDGLTLTGVIAEQDGASVTLLSEKGERTRFPRERIESIKESPVSIMPEKLPAALSPQELRDLFSYLESDGK